jgi:nucleoside-diphosphate-sugar epimerase
MDERDGPDPFDASTGLTSADVAVPEISVVTGAGGWLGKSLVRTLVARGGRVRGLVRDDADAALLEVLGSGVETVVGDLRDVVALDTLFDGVATAPVFHTAAVIHPVKSTREFFDVNVGGTELLLDRARRARASRLVHVSSNSPFGANPSPTDRFTEDSVPNPYMGYGRSKLEAEEIVLRASERDDVPAVIVRAPWFYGPNQPDRQTQWFRAVRKGRFPLIGSGENRRSMVYTDNLVQGLLRAESTPGVESRAYWIADAEPYAMTEVLATVREALVAEGFPVSGGQPRLPYVAGVMAEKLDAFLQDREKYIQPLHVLGELKDTIACDISRARAELGYDPQVALLEGMRRSIRWCVEHGQIL